MYAIFITHNGIGRLVYALMYSRIWINDGMLGILKATCFMGAQWLSGRVLDSRPRGHGFEPHWGHCVVVFEQDTFFLA